jgi:hypothetical protein
MRDHQQAIATPKEWRDGYEEPAYQLLQLLAKAAQKHRLFAEKPM